MITSYWIHPSILEKSTVNELIKKLFKKQINEIKKPTSSTLHIATNEIVFDNYGSQLFFISEDGLKSAIENKINPNDLFLGSKQITSLCLRRFHIELTGFEKEIKTDLIKKILLLGFDPNNIIYGNEEMILVSGKSMTHKIIDSLKSNKSHKIVTDQWIEACFTNNCYKSYNKYIMPPFYKLIITSSDLTSQQKLMISKIVKSNGGVFSEVFDLSIDCLIATSINRTQKTILALTKDIPIITPQWILKRDLNPIPYMLNWWCLSSEKRTLFSRLSFYIDNSLRDKIPLDKAITSYGGMIFNTVEFKTPYNVFILDDGSDSIQTVLQEYSTEFENKRIINQKVNILSPRWIWNCINENGLVDVNSSFEYKPFRFKCPLKDFKDKIIAILGYEDKDRIKISEIIREFGATVVYSFTKNAHFVITHMNNNPKLAKSCSDYGINMFSEAILFEIVRNGKLIDVNDPFVKEKYKSPKVKTIKLHHEFDDTEDPPSSPNESSISEQAGSFLYSDDFSTTD